MPKLPPVKRFVSSSGVRIYRIACQVFPLLSARVYLLLGAGPPTLFDTGSGRGDSTRHILDGLEAVGRDFDEPFRVEDLERIVITHGHIDHIGGAAALVERTGAVVAAHPFDCRAISDCQGHAETYSRGLERFLHQAGVEPEDQAKILAADLASSEGLRGVPVEIQIRDGDQLDGLKFVHTPGHAPGHLCTIVDNVLLSADHILARTVPQPWPESLAEHVSLADYLDSLDKIQRIDGLEFALAAHEPVVRDIYHRIDALRDSHLRRLGRVAEIIRGAGRPMTIAEIAEKMYAGPVGTRATLALCDVGARIEHLCGQGELAIANRDDIAARENVAHRYDLT